LLYATLHAFDQAGASVVIVERVPEGPEWAGVRDRLSRAAHGTV
jgi:L-threonylcarbamoyladenylate synthase